jgi:hypothetical protein
VDAQLLGFGGSALDEYLVMVVVEELGLSKREDIKNP